MAGNHRPFFFYVFLLYLELKERPSREKK